MKEDSTEKQECSLEDCPWCDTTGDVEKNRRTYWGTVGLIVAVLLILLLVSIILK